MTAQADRQLADLDAPQWSRPRIGRMTLSENRESVGDSRAAMEPAEDRPDDRGGVRAAAALRAGRNGAGRGSAG